MRRVNYAMRGAPLMAFQLGSLEMADPVTLAMLAGTAITAGGTLVEGAGAKKAGDFAATQYKQAGQQAFAASQRSADNERRDMQFAESRAQAVGAASGFGGATDTSTLKQIGDIRQEGTLRAMTRLFEGQDAQRTALNKASASRFEGKQAQIGSYFKAAGQVLKGVGSMGSPAGAAAPSAKGTLAGGGIGSDARYPLDNWSNTFG